MANYKGEKIDVADLELTRQELAFLVEQMVKRELDVATESNLSFDEVNAMRVDGYYVPTNGMSQIVCDDGGTLYRATALIRTSKFPTHYRHRES